MHQAVVLVLRVRPYQAIVLMACVRHDSLVSIACVVVRHSGFAVDACPEPFLVPVAAGGRQAASVSDSLAVGAVDHSTSPDLAPVEASNGRLQAHVSIRAAL